MKDYFKLLSVEVSEDTKARLDCALHLTDHPTEEEYAMILPRYDGKCPMRRKDGLCAIQAEAGENAIPAVCRLYPRGFREGEVSCANSCEAVVELLLREEPIGFFRSDVPAAFMAPPRIHLLETGGREMDIRMWLIHIVQDRRFSLADRLNRLGCAVRRMDEMLTVHDYSGVDLWLADMTKLPTTRVTGDIGIALKAVRTLLEQLDMLSDSIREYGQKGLSRFECEGELGREQAQIRLQSTCPKWEAWFENLIVNHMFFTQFPFQDRSVSLRDEVAALISVYALLKFMLMGVNDGSIESMIDIAAALFRLVDHTAFDRYAVPLIKECLVEKDINGLLVI